jgi:hypothetical protein
LTWIALETLLLVWKNDHAMAKKVAATSLNIGSLGVVSLG